MPFPKGTFSCYALRSYQWIYRPLLSSLASFAARRQGYRSASAMDVATIMSMCTCMHSDARACMLCAHTHTRRPVIKCGAPSCRWTDALGQSLYAIVRRFAELERQICEGLSCTSIGSCVLRYRMMYWPYPVGVIQISCRRFFHSILACTAAVQ